MRFELRTDGVFHLPDGDAKPTWICSPLTILAETRSDSGENWGRLLSFNDADGRPHEVAIPMSMLAGDAIECREMLLDRGLKIAPSFEARRNLSLYLMHHPVVSRARSVTRLGWHGPTFVLPDITFGNESLDRVILQIGTSQLDKFRSMGTLEEWQMRIAMPCRGNSRLMFALGASFAASLLGPLGEEGGGFHLRGSSSTGKTTALRVAGSVWGGGGIQGYVESWRATSNGLESTASKHCDMLLPLDELGQIDPRHAGEVAYLLANGSGKRRASANGGLREKLEWRLLFLSTGELGLADHMAQAGEQTRAGQDIRLVDIPADAGKGLGLFDLLHGTQNADEFSRSLRDASSMCFGVAARKFLERFVSSRTDSLLLVRRTQEQLASQLKGTSSNGEIARVARRFALVAAAGELATDFGIVPWRQGDSIAAASTCFLAWLDGRGGFGSHDDSRAIAQVRRFIQQFGTSRFPLLDNQGLLSGDDRAVTRADFRRDHPDGTSEWLIMNEVYKNEVCRGLDPRRVSRTLREKGFLKPDGTGRNSVPRTLPGVGQVRVYIVHSEIMREEGDAAIEV